MPSGQTPTTDKYSQLVADLRTAVFESPGKVDAALRQSAASGDGLSEPWRSYTLKVRDEASAATDADIEDLKAAGRTEDEIFEMTVAAAVGASLQTLNAGLRALGQAD
ncbi:MAG TPA: hypothetical protein VGH27_35910 [Streptosporangiaceae bacterium]|jgi:hypothetical protein